MLTIKRLKVLVCQIIWVFVATTVTWGYTGPDISSPGVQGDALSGDPTYQNKSVPKQQFPSQPQSGSSHTSRGSRGSVYSNPGYRTYGGSVYSNPGYRTYGGSVYSNPGYRTYEPLVSPPTTAVCGPQGCPVPGVVTGPAIPAPGMFGLFSQSGMGLGTCGNTAFLPHVGCKQFEVSAQVWYPTLYRSDVIWGTSWRLGLPGTQLDLDKDLQLGPRQYLGVYEGRCQVRCNWGLRFTFMPINFRSNTNPQISFWFGNQQFFPFVNTLTKWDRYVYRAELVYDWFHKCNAVSSLFAGYLMYDDKLTISQQGYFLSRSRSRTRGLYTAGASVERLIRDIGSATVSSECRASVQFDNDHFGWDAVWLGRIYMPMNCGRYGYLEGGFRWYVMETGQPTDYDKTSLAGPTLGMGLIF